MAEQPTTDVVILPPAGDAGPVSVARPAPPRSGGSDGYLVLGLLLGAVCGAAIGLLRAPHRGVETRERLLRGATAPDARPAPAASEAMAQILQYGTRPADEST